MQCNMKTCTQVVPAEYYQTLQTTANFHFRFPGVSRFHKCIMANDTGAKYRPAINKHRGSYNTQTYTKVVPAEDSKTT